MRGLRTATVAALAAALVSATVACSDAEGGAPVVGPSSSADASSPSGPGLVSTSTKSTEPPATQVDTAPPVPSSAGPATGVSVDDLVALLPSAADFPEGWVLEDGSPRTDFSAASGFFLGTCGGENADGRALRSLAWGVANGSEYRSPDGSWGYATVYGFPGPDEAERFMRDSRSLGSCTQSGEVPEGADPGEYDGFADGALDDKVRWSVAETSRTEPEAVARADSAFSLHTDDTVQSTHDKVEYSAQLRDISVFARFGSLVLVANIASYCCDTGYVTPAGTAAASIVDFRPVFALLADRVTQTMAARGLA